MRVKRGQSAPFSECVALTTGERPMSQIFGKRVVIAIPPGDEDHHDNQDNSPVVAGLSLEQNYPDGLAGHPEIQSLQQWLDLQG